MIYTHAEWHWFCDDCVAGNEEPYDSQDEAERAAEDHRREHEASAD